MAVALREARRIGLDRVPLYAGEDSLPSRATIERAGGVPESTPYPAFWNERLCKYGVSIRAQVHPMRMAVAALQPAPIAKPAPAVPHNGPAPCLPPPSSCAQCSH